MITVEYGNNGKMFAAFEGADGSGTHYDIDWSADGTGFIQEVGSGTFELDPNRKHEVMTMGMSEFMSKHNLVEAYFTEYCGVCNDWYADEERGSCRHIWYDDDGARGTGGNLDAKELAETKNAIHALLNAVNMADELKAAIQASRMGFDAIHLHGDILFGYSRVWFRLISKGGEILFFSEEITEAVRAENGEGPIGVAIMWLIGLDNEKTSEQNKMTIEWIDEWGAA